MGGGSLAGWAGAALVRSVDVHNSVLKQLILARHQVKKILVRSEGELELGAF